jgi:hypothetical protein
MSISQDTGVRKTGYELTPDVRSSTVWEFDLDADCTRGRNEATVRLFTIFGAACPLFISRAVFTLANGSTIKGIISPHPFATDGDQNFVLRRFR